jgi:hypothetical protein
MVDAATGGRSVLGRGIEKVYLGVPQGSLEFLNFDSVEIGRIDDENLSAAITGSDGRDRGTPADIKFGNKLKYSLTPSRILFDLTAMLGKAKDKTEERSVASVTIGAGPDAGTGYTAPVFLTATGGGGSGFHATATVDGGGAFTAINVDDPGHGYTSAPTIVIHEAGGGGSAAVLTAVLTTDPTSWLVRMRPDRTNELRAATMYLFEGGSYSAMMQTGRRVPMLQLTDAANKRVEVDVTYEDPTGDTISGFFIAKTGNGGSFAGKISTRGRRPYDADYDAEKSLFLKVTAVDANGVTFDTQIATKGDGVGGGFPGSSYSGNTFTVPIATDDFDGYTNVPNPATGDPLGLFGENFEAYEVTVGHDTTGFTNGDEFEIPAFCPALTKSVNAESRLSSFHLIRKLNGTTDVRIDSGNLKLERPFKAYRANGRRIPQAIDPMGDVAAEWQFKKRLFDRYFRVQNDQHARFTIWDKYQIDSGVFESVEVYAGQVAVKTMKSGDIPNKNVLEETITLVSEQPESAGSPPTGFDGTYSFEVNVRTKVDPSWLV